MLNFYHFRQDYLKFEGNDRLDLVNRLSTNHVNTLQQFKGIKTVLTNDKGRFVDLLTLYNFGDFVFTTCSFNNAPNVLSHLEKYTIMDDFNPTNMANTHETILFSGERCTEFINDIFKINTEKLSNNDFEIYVKDDRHSMIAMNDDRFEGCLFIFAAKDHDYWQSEIFNDSLKSKYKLNAFDDIQYESKRIGYGIPAFGKEITDVTNPLECGLNKYVSFTKGCYIGQEVIARLDTYDKISKHMIKIDSDNEIRAEGSKILTDGKECGYVTSASGNAGLGFVKTIFLDFDKKYQIKQNENLINCNLEQIKN